MTPLAIGLRLGAGQGRAPAHTTSGVRTVHARDRVTVKAVTDRAPIHDMNGAERTVPSARALLPSIEKTTADRVPAPVTGIHVQGISQDHDTRRGPEVFLLRHEGEWATDGMKMKGRKSIMHHGTEPRNFLSPRQPETILHSLPSPSKKR